MNVPFLLTVSASQWMTAHELRPLPLGSPEEKQGTNPFEKNPPLPIIKEPLTDVMTTDGEVKVIVELPGVAKSDIKLRGTEKSLTVSVDAEKRKYYKKLELPVKVDPKSAKSKYMNGVLEVTIKQSEKEKEPEGEEIKIE